MRLIRHMLALLNFKKPNYNENGYYVRKSMKIKNPLVTVILPVYNAEKTLKKTIDSIINQTIGFNNLELILIDDSSTDRSRSIVSSYARSYSNIVSIFFKKNSGSPAIPRNIGIDFAKGEFMMFVDSDDWLAPEGIEILYKILKKTGDNYAIGRTIRVEDNKYTIAGEYNSCKNRESIHPRAISHIFHHLGPTARMMKTQFIKENEFQFPNMRFAEDKQFFIDVLTNCSSISTTDKIIYYVNRNKDNKSLVSRTSIFEKMDTNIAVINYVIQKNLPEKIERMVLNRLYEFDSITRLFSRHHFLNSKNKERYFEKFAEVLDTTTNLRYDFTENFFEPWHKILVKLFKSERYDDIIKLIDWRLKEPTKEIMIRGGLPYYRLPLEQDYQFARIPLLVVHHSTEKAKNEITIRFEAHGGREHDIQSLVIRDRANHLNEQRFPVKLEEDRRYTVSIPYKAIRKLSPASYAIFIRYDSYRNVSIKMDTRNIINYQKKTFDFYTTVGDNYGLNIK